MPRLTKSVIRAKIDVQDLVPLFRLHLHKELVAGDACIGDQNVELAASGLFSAAHKAVDGVCVREVGRHDDAVTWQAGLYLFQHTFARARQGHLCARFGQRHRNRATNATGGSGHQRCASAQIKHAALILPSCGFCRLFSVSSLVALAEALSN